MSEISNLSGHSHDLPRHLTGVGLGDWLDVELPPSMPKRMDFFTNLGSALGTVWPDLLRRAAWCGLGDCDLLLFPEGFSPISQILCRLAKAFLS